MFRFGPKRYCEPDKPIVICDAISHHQTPEITSTKCPDPRTSSGSCAISCAATIWPARGTPHLTHAQHRCAGQARGCALGGPMCSCLFAGLIAYEASTRALCGASHGAPPGTARPAAEGGEMTLVDDQPGCSGFARRRRVRQDAHARRRRRHATPRHRSELHHRDAFPDRGLRPRRARSTGRTRRAGTGVMIRRRRATTATSTDKG